jgi:hypothetical protein
MQLKAQDAGLKELEAQVAKLRAAQTATPAETPDVPRPRQRRLPAATTPPATATPAAAEAATPTPAPEPAAIVPDHIPAGGFQFVLAGNLPGLHRLPQQRIIQ